MLSSSLVEVIGNSPDQSSKVRHCPGATGLARRSKCKRPIPFLPQIAFAMRSIHMRMLVTISANHFTDQRHFLGTIYDAPSRCSAVTPAIGAHFGAPRGHLRSPDARRESCLCRWTTSMCHPCAWLVSRTMQLCLESWPALLGCAGKGVKVVRRVKICHVQAGS